MSDCIFCNIDQSRIIDSDKYFNVILDIYPVTELHTLIIPHRHVASYFELTEQEQSSLFLLLKKHKNKLQKMDSTITGLNIGINDGEDAGQTYDERISYLQSFYDDATSKIPSQTKWSPKELYGDRL